MKIFLFLSLISFNMLIAGTVYLAIDSTPSLEEEIDNTAVVVNLDKGGITAGYNNPIFKKDKIEITLGGSYTLLPMKNQGVEYGFLSIYCSPNYAFNKKIIGWLSFGINIPTYDIDEHENGLTYGMGINFKVGERNEIGLGYIENTSSFEINGSEVEYTWDRYALFFGYSL